MILEHVADAMGGLEVCGARPAGEDRGPSGTRRPAPVDTPGGIHALTQAVAVDRCRRRDGHGRDRHRQFRPAPTTAGPPSTEPAGHRRRRTEAGTGRGHRRRLPPLRRAANADLVIWTDNTRQAAVQEIAGPFAEENGITVAVQELAFGDIRDQLIAHRAHRRGSRHHHRRPRLARRAGRRTASSSRSTSPPSPTASTPSPIQAFTYDGQTYGLPYAIENIALRAQHRPRARGAGDVRGDDADRHRLQGRPRRRPDGARPGRAGRAAGRRLPPAAVPVGVRWLHLRPERRRHVQPRRRRHRLRGRACRRRLGCRSRRPPGCSAPTSPTT